jgi:Tc5 transposase DNA-binding domain.
MNKRKSLSLEEKAHGTGVFPFYNFYHMEKQNSFEQNMPLTKKKNRKSTHADIEKALLEWYKNQRNLNIPVSGPLMQEKAKTFPMYLFLAFH